MGTPGRTTIRHTSRARRFLGWLLATLALVGLSASPARAAATVTDLGAFVPAALNRNGVVVGDVVDEPTPGSSVTHAAVWKNGTLTRLPERVGTIESEALAVNDAGRVVGLEYTASGDVHAVYWDDVAGPFPVGPPVGADADFSQALDVDTFGNVVGVTTLFADASHYLLGFYDPPAGPAVPVGVGDLDPNQGSSLVGAITDNGALLLGRVQGTNSKDGFYLWSSADPAAPGVKLALTPGTSGFKVLAGSVYASLLIQNDIASDGALFGYKDAGPPTWYFRAPNGAETQIVGLAGHNAINAQHVVAGTKVTGTPSDPVHAAIWDAATQQVTDLNTLLPPNSGFRLVAALAINDDGDIAGVGIHDDQEIGFLLSGSQVLTLAMTAEPPQPEGARAGDIIHYTVDAQLTQQATDLVVTAKFRPDLLTIAVPSITAGGVLANDTITWNLTNTTGTVPPLRFDGTVKDPLPDGILFLPMQAHALATLADASQVEADADATVSNLSIQIAAVEITQSIQEYQPITELESRLETSGEPPVPIIAGKPAVMRVYFGKVPSASTVRLQVTGAITATKTFDLQPQCAPEKARNHADGCPSLDFYFTPPTGSWDVHLTLRDEDDTLLQQKTLSVTSRETLALHVRGLAVCDSRVGAVWACGERDNLLGKERLLRRIMPTAAVSLDLIDDRVLSPMSAEDGGVPIEQLSRAVKKVGKLYTDADAAADAAAGRVTLYFGVYRGALDEIGISFLLFPGAMAPDFVERFSQDATLEVITHELGHVLNLRHTNTVDPSTDTAPGCYNFAEDPHADWTHLDNRVQSDQRLEWGFNVETQTLIDPNVTFDLMGYCLPRWLSPVHYRKVIETLSVAAGGSTLARTAVSAAALTSGTFWEIAGTIPSTGVVFDPLFAIVTDASSEAGDGTHVIEVQNGAGGVLFTRHFTPAIPQTDTEDADVQADPVFSELVPVTAGAAKILVKAPGGAVLGTLQLGGTPPTVGITAPSGGFDATGTKTLQWTIVDPDSTAFTSRVAYSADGGAHWTQLGDVPGDTSLAVDFDTLPGTTGATASIQVTVSDGVNTGSATSPAFAVAKKNPSTAIIDTPEPGYTQAAADPIILVGAGYDPDDGMLTGTHLQWSSNLQGTLGAGSPLSTTLQPGAHTITLTATDADGNSVSDTTDVVIGGAPPALSVTTTPATGGCTSVTIAATPGTNGAPLTNVQFSLDRGLTYTTIPSHALPLSFVVPGTGNASITARAYDASRQSSAKTVDVTNPAGCAAHAPACIGGTTISKIALTATKIGNPKKNGTLSVKGTLDFTPGNPAVVSPATRGAQLLIEDLGSGARAVFDLTHFTAAVPPGPVGTGCGKKDGWKKLAYKNASGTLDPPACAAKPAGSFTLGFKDLRAKLQKGKSKGIPFTASVRGLDIPSLVGPARVTVVLGGSVAASEAGECGSHSFEPASCTRKKDKLVCKVK